MIPGSATPFLLAKSDGDYKIERSLRFNSADSAYLNRTPSSAGNRKTWTWSGWLKRYSTGIRQIFFSCWTGSTRLNFGYLEDERFEMGTQFAYILKSNALFRDSAAWQHWVVSVDTTLSSNRCKVYLNGSEITSWNTNSFDSTFAQNADTDINQAAVHYIGQLGTGTSYLNAGLADVHFIDGQALAATDFGGPDDNNVWQPKAYSGTYGTNGFHLSFSDSSSNAALGTDSSGNSNTWTVNNLVAVAGLSTANQGFNVVTYTGNGGTQSIPVGFAPDFVWIKERNGTKHHALCDSVRGNGNLLYSALSNGEQDIGSSVVALTSTGFDLGYNSGFSVVSHNYNSVDHVAWCWKAGGTAVSNSDGTITSSVSANNTYGFSIVSYNSGSSTGNYTLGHGLSSAPKFIIHKTRSTGNWWVHHESVIDDMAKYLQLNSSAGLATNSAAMWGAAAPTSSVFGVRVGDLIGTSQDAIAYCWSEISGFSKFSTYTGNGSSTGPVVTTGFKPKFILIKSTGVGHWMMIDTERNNYDWLFANLTDAQASDTTDHAIDILNDGFQIKSAFAAWNTNGQTYTYAAFADKPPGEIIDSLIDTPTNYEADSGNNAGNYATWNPLDVKTTIALSNGNLDLVGSSDGRTRATMAMPSGQWYWEITIGAVPASNHIGIWATNVALSNDTYRVIYRGDGYWIVGGSAAAEWSSVATGDIVGITFDASTRETKFYKNNSLLGTKTAPALPDGSAYTPAVILAGSNSSLQANFGQRPFAYTPPTGYKSLCTQNLDDPLIADGSTAFDAKLYTGNGSTQSISGFNFQPDFVWIKSRTSSGHHSLNDSVRGATKILYTNLTNAEVTSSIMLTAFNSAGFSVGSDNDVNKNNDSFVSWAWDAGTSNTSISAGGLNSSLYDQSRTWSGGTSSGTMYSGAWTQVFNNVETNTYSDGNSVYVYQNTATLNFSPALPTGAIQIWGRAGSSGASGDKVTFSDGTNTYTTGDLSNQTAQWIDVESGNSLSGITSVTVHSGGSSGAGMVLGAIRIGSKKLVDSSVSVGSIPALASTVRANPSAGFSIVTWSGSGSNATIGHGLNAAPVFMLLKRRDATTGMYAYHSAVSPAKTLYLYGTTYAETYAAAYNNTAPTTSVFSVGSASATNSGNMLAYCFAPVAGFSAFGSYTGNGSTDGVFIYTGFAPRWLLFKRHDSTSDWSIYDTTRDPDNVAGNKLEPNTSDTESGPGTCVDILSNGFKFRRSSLENGGNDLYLYAAFAEHPFKTARAR